MAFQVPPVSVGQSVLWYPDKGDAPHAAIVVKVTPWNISVVYFTDNNLNHAIRDGVRHRDDPGIKQDDLNTCGCWDHTEQTKIINELADAYGLGAPKPAKKVG